MKTLKLLLAVGVIFSCKGKAQDSLALINWPYQIEIYDSSSNDFDIYDKDAISRIRYNDVGSNDYIQFTVANVGTRTYKASNFSQYANDSIMARTIQDISADNFAAYQINYHRTSANFIDSMFFVYGSDTVFHQYNPVSNDTTTGVGPIERH